MDVLDILLARANQLGFDEEIVHQLNDALLPLCNALGNPVDLGYYFYNADRCPKFVLNLPSDVNGECAILLWDVCEKVQRNSVSS